MFCVCCVVCVCVQTQNPYHNASLLEQSGLHRITLGTSTVSSVSSARYSSNSLHTFTNILEISLL